MKRLSRDSFILGGDEINVLADLAHLTFHSRQSITTRLRDLGESACKFLEKLTPTATAIVTGCKLEPGETCLMCNATAEKKKRVVKRPKCPVCEQVFTRGKPWRLYRGRRLHVSCIK